MSTSKELVELTELYKNIQLQEKDNTASVTGEKTGEKIDKKKIDTKDKKEDEKEKKDGKVIVNNNSSSEVKDTNTTGTGTGNGNGTKNGEDKKTTYHGTDRSGRDFDDPEADSDVKGGSKERKPINQDIKGSDGKVIGKKTINPNSPDYQKTFEKPKNVNTKELPSELTKGKEKEIEKANTEKKVEVKPEVKPEVKKTEADYIGKSQGLLGKDDWLKKTSNSPAARSGAFKDEERWAQQLKHRQWQKDNNRGAFKVKKEKAKVYTNKVDAFLNNKKVGDPKGTNNYKILSPLEQEMESFQPMEEDSNWYKNPKGVNPKTGETSLEMDRQHSKKGNIPDKALRAYRNVRTVVDTFTGNKDGAFNRANNPKGIERVATGLTDKFTGGETDYDRKGPSKKPKTTSKTDTVTSEGFDAYDSVMNYLIGTDQVESVEEANYVMMEMDGRTIMEIKKIMNESVVNRADVLGGTPAAKNAQRGIGKYTPGPGVTKDFQLDPNFKIKA